MPLLAVERTDVMRVIIQVPERDVPFVDCQATRPGSEVDALPGVVFKTQGADKVEVSRLAASEDPHTRMMRTEVDLKNPEGTLRRGMFGRVALTLSPGASGAIRIPSGALSGKAAGGRGVVRVVRNDKAAIVPVLYASNDNGSGSRDPFRADAGGPSHCPGLRSLDRRNRRRGGRRQVRQGNW